MKNKICLFFLLTFILFCFTGCYDANSIESSYYIVAVGIDEGQNELYNLSIQIAKNENGSLDSSSSQSSSYSIYEVECQTFESGINILNNYLNKSINLSHCSAIIFSESLARKGVGDILNSLASNNEIRPSSYILISSKTANEVLEKVSNSGEKFSSRFYEYVINSEDYTGYSGKTTFEEFVSKTNSSSQDGIAIYTYVNDKTVQNSGFAIFKGDRMIGRADVLDSISHLILTNKLKEALITIPNPFNNDSHIDLKKKKKKNSQINISMINNTPFIISNIFLTANIKTSGKHFDYTKNSNIETVEYYAEKYIENKVSNYLYKLSKDYDADVLGFQRILSKNCLTNSELEDLKFKEVFKDSYFNTNVDLQIESTHLFSKE